MGWGVAKEDEDECVEVRVVGVWRLAEQGGGSGCMIGWNATLTDSSMFPSVPPGR